MFERILALALNTVITIPTAWHSEHINTVLGLSRSAIA